MSSELACGLSQRGIYMIRFFCFLKVFHLLTLERQLFSYILSRPLHILPPLCKPHPHAKCCSDLIDDSVMMDKESIRMELGKEEKGLTWELKDLWNEAAHYETITFMFFFPFSPCVKMFLMMLSKVYSIKIDNFI